MIGGVRVPVGARKFSSHHHVQIGSGTHPPSYPRSTRAFFLRVKHLWREADHSPPSSAEVKNACWYTSTPQYVFMEWCSVKRRAQGRCYFSLNIPTVLLTGHPKPYGPEGSAVYLPPTQPPPPHTHTHTQHRTSSRNMVTETSKNYAAAFRYSTRHFVFTSSHAFSLSEHCTGGSTSF
jgi:hypothetical protein